VSDQVEMFSLTSPRRVDPVSEYPPWYTPSKERRTANRRVLLGLHPMGAQFGGEETSCGSCAHRYARVFSKRYLKCRLVNATGGPATDVRCKWRGCEHWEAG